jgi:hypothetical protein
MGFYMTEDYILHSYCRGNLKSYICTRLASHELRVRWVSNQLTRLDICPKYLGLYSSTRDALSK